MTEKQSDTSKIFNRRDEDIRYGVILTKIHNVEEGLKEMKAESKELHKKIDSFITMSIKSCEDKHLELRKEIDDKVAKKVDSSTIVSIVVVMGVLIAAIELLSHLLGR